MSSEERRLPLFPLNTVLFPYGSLPLQIFEDRYKRMLQDCLDGDSKFGVVLIKAGSEVGEPAIPHTTGTMVHIMQSNEVRGGRYFVSVIGQQRFRIKDITQYRPYMAAQVEMLDDETESWVPPTEMEAIRQALTIYVRLNAGLRGGWVREPQTTDDPVALSYNIAATLNVGTPEKQVLLEEDSTPKRLEAELDLLRRETESLKQRVSYEFRRRFSRQ